MSKVKVKALRTGKILNLAKTKEKRGKEKSATRTGRATVEEAIDLDEAIEKPMEQYETVFKTDEHDQLKNMMGEPIRIELMEDHCGLENYL